LGYLHFRFVSLSPAAQIFFRPTAPGEFGAHQTLGLLVVALLQFFTVMGRSLCFVNMFQQTLLLLRRTGKPPSTERFVRALILFRPPSFRVLPQSLARCAVVPFQMQFRQKAVRP
jgi:hypothetical protein